MKTHALAALSVGAALFVTLAHAKPAVKMVGGMLVNSSGMTLYAFDKDVAGSGKGTCNGPCAALWPPAMAQADAKTAGEVSVVTRDDGVPKKATRLHLSCRQEGWGHDGR